MSNTIADQTWEMLNNNEIQSSLATAYKIKKNSDARRAHGKDIVLPSDPRNQKTALTKKSDGKADLPYPGTKWNGMQDEDDSHLIALIGKVLSEQAKTNSNFWSIVWKQASQSMMLEVKFAPVIGDAIKASYTAQSEATSAEASMSYWDGFINITSFAGAVGLGAFEETMEAFKEGKNTVSEIDDETDEDATKSNGIDGEAKKDVEANKTLNDDSNKMLDKEAKAYKQRAKSGGNQAWSKYKKFQKYLSGFLMKANNKAILMQGFSAGTSGLMKSQYQSQISIYQMQQGTEDAIQKQVMQYTQFYGEAFKREEDLRQGAQQQGIDNAMNILKTEVDTITQAVTAMFRG